MTLDVIGGSLQPKTHDGSSTDAVYGVDASGAYLGVVPAAQAAAKANGPPPSIGQWRWTAGAWAPYASVEERSRLIEMQRDAKIASGVAWNGRQWYADSVFQQQLAAYLQAFTLGIIPAGGTAPVRAMDKTIYPLTQADLQALAAALMAFVNQAYATSWAAKSAIGA